MTDFSACPFGARSAHLDIVNIWRKTLVEGEQERIGDPLRRSAARTKGSARM